MKVANSTETTVEAAPSGWAMTLPRMVTALLFMVVMALNTHAVRDPDLWWHLAVGEYMLESWTIPTADPNFAFTTAGQSWFMHEWLSEIVMVLIYNVGGLEGLSIFFGVVMAVTYLLLYLCSPRQSYLTALVTMFLAFAGFGYTSVRPHMFNLLLGAVIVYLVESIKDERLSVRWLWVIPPLMVVWVNLHSGFLLAFAILGVYIVGEAAALWLGNDERALGWSKLRTLVMVTAAAAVASLFNNNGFAVWLYPFETLGSEAMRVLILEWHSPDFHNWYRMLFALIFIGTLTLMALNKKRPTVTELLFIVGTGLASLQSTRHISLFLILAVPIINRQLVSFLAETPLRKWVRERAAKVESLTRVQNVVNWLLVLGAAGLLLGWIIMITGQTDTSVAFHFPVEAVEYMEEEGLTDGRVFNSYGWGGYLIWRDIQPFVDGRADLYGDDFLFQFMETDDLEPGWQEVLDAYDIDYILVKDESLMARVLPLEGDTWQLLYRDDVAVLFSRVPNS